MSILSSRIVRFKSNVRNKFAAESLLDVSTNSTIEGVRGNATKFQTGVFDSAGGVMDLSLVDSLNLKVRVSQEKDSTILLDKTLAAEDLDLTLDAESWTDGTKQHAEFTCSNAEMNIDLGGTKKTYWMVMTTILTGGEEVTIAAGNFVMNEDNNAAADPPPENPGTLITLEQADARYCRIITRTAEEGPPVSDDGSVISITGSPLMDASPVVFPKLHRGGVQFSGRDQFYGSSNTVAKYDGHWIVTSDLSDAWTSESNVDAPSDATGWSPEGDNTGTFGIAVVAHTPADAVGQICIVGDDGGNHLIYQCVSINPVIWQLKTAGVIWNEVAARFEKLVVRDGTIQTDIYTLS